MLGQDFLVGGADDTETPPSQKGAHDAPERWRETRMVTQLRPRPPGASSSSLSVLTCLCPHVLSLLS